MEKKPTTVIFHFVEIIFHKLPVQGERNIGTVLKEYCNFLFSLFNFLMENQSFTANLKFSHRKYDFYSL